MEECYRIEWGILVAEAVVQLQGTCPLLCDETLIEVNKYIKELERKENEISAP
jgi:hypothetical protein